MKKIKLIRALAGCIFGVCLMLMDGCTKQSATPTTPSCSTTGTNVNIGSTTGGTYQIGFGTIGSITYLLSFSNISLDMSIEGVDYSANTGNAGTILDVGPQSCLDFSYSGTPTATTVAFTDGHGYVGKFNDGHTVKFIALRYLSGLGLITYVFQ